MLDPSLQQLVIQLHVFTTFFMTGVVWFVQVLHYPFFRLIRIEDGIEASKFHQRRTRWILIPVMLAELITGVQLLSSSWIAQYGNYLWANLALLLVIWGITLIKFVPLHKRLSEQFDQNAVNSLVALNWVRTVLWSLRSFILLSFLG